MIDFVEISHTVALVFLLLGQILVLQVLRKGFNRNDEVGERNLWYGQQLWSLRDDESKGTDETGNGERNTTST